MMVEVIPSFGTQLVKIVWELSCPFITKVGLIFWIFLEVLKDHKFSVLVADLLERLWRYLWDDGS
jgi:hypothetical protein